MRIRAIVVGLISCGFILGGQVSAQTTSGKISDQTIPGDITFEVPINLTRLSPYLSKVAVTCMVGETIPKMGTMGTTSSGRGVLSNRVELPVSAGQVVTKAEVVITVPSTPLFKPGQILNYQCDLSALSSEPGVGSGWQPFDPKNGTSFNVSPTPLPIKSTFPW